MLVKCRICGNKIERNDAYKVVVNDKNEYYCNEKEYKQKQKQIADKENTIKIINEIFGYEITNSAFFKELKALSENNSYEKIYSFIYDNRQMLDRSMSRDFTSEYGKIRYFSTIIKNNIVDKVSIVGEDKDAPWRPQSKLTSSVQDVIMAAGTKYSTTPIGFKALNK